MITSRRRCTGVQLTADKSWSGCLADLLRRDGLCIWLWILGLEDPIPVQKEVDRARPGFRSPILVVERRPPGGTGRSWPGGQPAAWGGGEQGDDHLSSVKELVGIICQSI